MLEKGCLSGADDKTLPSLSLILCAGPCAVWILFFIISTALWKGRAPFFYEEFTRKNGAADETRVASFYYFIYQLYLNANTWAAARAPSCDKPNKLLHSRARELSHAAREQKTRKSTAERIICSNLGIHAHHHFCVSRALPSNYYFPSFDDKNIISLSHSNDENRTFNSVCFVYNCDKIWAHTAWWIIL